MRLKFILSILISFLFLPMSWSQSYEELADKANRLTMTNADSSIHYFNLAEKGAKAKNDSSALTFIYSSLSGLYSIQQNYSKQKEYSWLILQYAQTKKDSTKAFIDLGGSYRNLDLKIADSLYNIAEKMSSDINDTIMHSNLMRGYGGVKSNSGDHYAAIEYYLKAEKLTPSDLARSIIFNNTAILFLKVNNIPRAREYIQRALDICDKKNYKTYKPILLITYAKVLNKEGKTDLAINELLNSINILKNTKKKNDLIKSYNLLTGYYFKQKKIDKAIDSNEKSKELFDKVSVLNRAHQLVNQSKIDIHQKKYSDAIKHSLAAIRIGEEKSHSNFLIPAYRLASTAYEKTNQTKLSFENFKKYTFLKDSIYRTDRVALFTSLESKHNREEASNKIALLDSKNQVQEVRLSQQKTIMTIGGIGLTLISSLLFFLFRSNKKIKSQNQIISNSLEEKDTLLREIHHRVKNNLQLVSSLLGLQSRTIEDPKALEALTSGKARVRSMALIHQNLYNRDNLTGISVKEYLEKLCRELITTYQVDTDKINLVTEIEDINLDVDTLVPLGLIINELLTNALKYAFPNGKEGNIVVKFFENAGQLSLEVKDDGVGMDISNRSSNSFGYKLVNTLLRQMRGKMHQREGKGTHIVLSINEYKIAA